MKYLKLFENWNTAEDERLRNEFINITDNYLSFLKDDGATVKYAQLRYPNINKKSSPVVLKLLYKKRPYIYMVIGYENIENSDVSDITYKTWDDIKDTILSYLEYVNSNYKFERIPGTFGGKIVELNLIDDNGERSTLKLSLDEILSNELDIDDLYVLYVKTRVYL